MAGSAVMALAARAGSGRDEDNGKDSDEGVRRQQSTKRHSRRDKSSVASSCISIASRHCVVAWHLAHCGIVSWHCGVALCRVKRLRNNEIIVLL
jgi:hypothetical protein